MAPFFRGHKVVKTLLRSSQLPTYSTVQMDSTLFANNSQHCWMSHVASVCIPCCIMLRVVSCRYIRFHTLQHGRNRTQHCWRIVGRCRVHLHIAQAFAGLCSWQWHLNTPLGSACIFLKWCLKLCRFFLNVLILAWNAEIMLWLVSMQQKLIALMSIMILFSWLENWRQVRNAVSEEKEE